MSAPLLDLITTAFGWDSKTGQRTFPDGTVICLHARQASSHRLTRPGWRLVQHAGRWVRRRQTAPLLIVTTRCPDCPAIQVDALDPGVSGYRIQLAPHVTIGREAT